MRNYVQFWRATENVTIRDSNGDIFQQHLSYQTGADEDELFANTEEDRFLNDQNPPPSGYTKTFEVVDVKVLYFVMNKRNLVNIIPPSRTDDDNLFRKRSPRGSEIRRFRLVPIKRKA